MYMGPARAFSDYLIVRSGRDPLALLPAVRKIVAGLDPELPVQGARTMEENLFLLHSYQRFSTLLLGVFAALALGLAVVGIYGVFSYAVAARTREFGIRLATGARRADILRLVLREAAILSLAGLAVGLPAALATSRVLRSMVERSGCGRSLDVCGNGRSPGRHRVGCQLHSRRGGQRELDPLQALRCD